MKGKYLITTDNWFIAPDGKNYRAVWGDVEIVDDSILGIKTNRNASNWFAKVGTENNHVIVAGCQIHYSIRCDKKPSITEVEDYHTTATEGCKKFDRPSQIWIAE